MNRIGHHLAAIAIVFATALSACSHAPGSAITGHAPPLELETYFDGSVRSWGVIEDRFGGVRKTFVGEHRGTVRDGVLHLTQKLRFADGSVSERQWEIRRSGPTRYSAKASHIAGGIEPEVRDGAVHLRYVTRSGQTNGESNLGFDQWLWHQTPQVVFNRADIRKFGIRVARLTEVFVKP